MEANSEKFALVILFTMAIDVFFPRLHSSFLFVFLSG